LFAAAREQVLSALFILLADGQLYTATVADFSGTDPMIYRKTLRTERSDLKHLNGERLLMIFSAPTMFIHELLSFLSLSFLLLQLQTL
jgi:Sema domain